MKEIHKKQRKFQRNGSSAKGAEELANRAKLQRTLLRCRIWSIILEQNKILKKRENQEEKEYVCQFLSGTIGPGEFDRAG